MKRTALYKTHLFALCFFLGTILAFSQTSTADWSAESYLVTVNAVDVEIESHLTKQGTSFVWEQIGYNTSDTNTFVIASATGNWNAQDNLGELSYELSSGESSTSSLTVTGTTEGITMLLIVYGTNGAADESYTFHIETFTNL